mmetsp:Transcript_6586/g.19953  ORF Transcript_6586/g.19953 Transcript_6586/m.19953 type:complete len:255 (-) Transcript_6586:936-1700(-)
MSTLKRSTIQRVTVAERSDASFAKRFTYAATDVGSSRVPSVALPASASGSSRMRNVEVSCSSCRVWWKDEARDVARQHSRKFSSVRSMMLMSSVFGSAALNADRSDPNIGVAISRKSLLRSSYCSTMLQVSSAASTASKTHNPSSSLYDFWSCSSSWRVAFSSRSLIFAAAHVVMNHSSLIKLTSGDVMPSHRNALTFRSRAMVIDIERCTSSGFSAAWELLMTERLNSARSAFAYSTSDLGHIWRRKGMASLS